MTHVTRYFVGLGSNLGDRLGTLRAAVAELAALDGVELRGQSGVWETRPLGPGVGPFLNAALELHSSLGAEALLEQLLTIERRHGRIRTQRWGDRTLDLDLLCGFELDGAAPRELTLDTPSLTLPHPELPRRDFVLQPLLDIDPDLVIAGRRCAQLLAALDERERTLLRRLAPPLAPDLGGALEGATRR